MQHHLATLDTTLKLHRLTLKEQFPFPLIGINNCSIEIFITQQRLSECQRFLLLILLRDVKYAIGNL